MSVSDRMELVALTGEPEEMLALQRVIGAAPGFALAVTGLPPGPADARSTFTVLPEGRSEDDGFVYGVYLDGQMIGCADVVRGYPDPSTAFIGLLLISEDSKRRGCGTAAYEALEAVSLRRIRVPARVVREGRTLTCLTSASLVSFSPPWDPGHSSGRLSPQPAQVMCGAFGVLEGSEG